MATIEKSAWLAALPEHQRRHATRNPHMAACLLHLRRICGTCGHFEGQLRPSRVGPDLEAASVARCAYFDQPRNLNYNAGKCNRWHRKSAAYQEPGK